MLTVAERIGKTNQVSVGERHQIERDVDIKAMARQIYLVLSLVFALTTLNVSPCFSQGIVFDFPSSVLDASQRDFISHRGTGPYSNYLALDLAWEPFAKLRLGLESVFGRALSHRGEAHITVITPVEFDNALQGFVTMDEIDEIANAMDLTRATVQAIGVGRGDAEIANHSELTYFVIVRSADLLRIRQEVARLYFARGGDPALFQPGHFYPHVTIGFTLRDLHESDGVVKDESTRMGDVVLREPLQ